MKRCCICEIYYVSKFAFLVTCHLQRFAFGGIFIKLHLNGLLPLTVSHLQSYLSVIIRIYVGCYGCKFVQFHLRLQYEVFTMYISFVFLNLFF